VIASIALNATASSDSNLQKSRALPCALNSRRTKDSKKRKRKTKEEDGSHYSVIISHP
jgi:hypothetical protein